MTEVESLGQKLISLRGIKSRKEVAEAVNISVSALTMYELDERVPRDEVKIRLARYYKTTVGALFYA
jgi:putative transcriptional regulator